MKLELESGTVIDEPSEADVVESIEGEGFAVLGNDPMTYIQCATHPDTPGEYVLEYQDGALDRHFRAVDEPVTLPRVIAAFTRYIRMDPSWKDDFRWELDDLSGME